MLLTIDSGNSNVVFGLYDLAQQTVIKAFRTVNEPTRTADEYAVWLNSLMMLNGFELNQIEAAVIGSVVPEASFNIISLCRRYLNCEPVVVGDKRTKLNLNILIDRPEQVGADRLVNAVAGFERYGGSLIIIDFGTATTFDIVNKDGDYAGGVIAPGVRLSLRSLYMAAAKLPLVEIAKPENYIGKDTESAMQSGVYWGYMSMVEGMVARIIQEFGSPMQVIATGGLSELFADHTDKINVTDRTLTLRGLAQIYQLNA
ncbi:MAG: type III pantothenate kinase [Alphaproteobacteria bacterium]